MGKFLSWFHCFLSVVCLMKYKRLWLLLAFVAFPSFAEYQQQWFSQFQELDGNMNFVCETQCFALVWPISGADYTTLQWTFQWNGVVGYGFVVGQQIIPWDTLSVDGNIVIDQQFSFSALSFYSQIPADAQLVFLVQGNVTWNTIHLWLNFMTFYNKIWQWWKDFWTMETLTPYSINLRYGVKLLWVSIVKYGYWLFILAMLYILFFVKWDKENKFRKIFFRGIGIFLFIGIRNFITDAWIVQQGLTTYTNQSYENKTFFDLWDYIVFTDKIRKRLQLDEWKRNCKIFVDSFQDWPYKWHWDMLYLKPCELVLTWSEADYLLYYRTPVATWDLQKPVLLEYNGNYLLNNK